MLVLGMTLNYSPQLHGMSLNCLARNAELCRKFQLQLHGKSLNCLACNAELYRQLSPSTYTNL